MSELREILQNLGHPRVVVVGDLMLDRYVFGSVSRISPEAPIPVLKVSSEDEQPGGAASVAMDLRAFRAEVSIGGYVAADFAAEALERRLTEVGVDTIGVVEVEDRATTLKTRMVARSAHHAQQVLRVDTEDVHAYGEDDASRLREAFASVLPGARCVVISDYAKGVVSAEMARYVIDTARAAGVPVVVDPKGRDYTRYAGATLITPNRGETAGALGIDAITRDNVIEAAGQLIEAAGVDAAVVTLDKDGMALVGAEEPGYLVQSKPREVYDVTGAGDVVAATLAISLGDGLALRDAVALANCAAGVAVTKLGAVPVTREEVAAALRAEGASRHRVVDLGTLRPELALLRKAGRAIVFTNGCFDVLHAGHARYLQFARSHGDVLVVGLNSDGSVRRLKGPSRPINDQEDRAETLAAFSCVDYVVTFQEDTPLDLIRAVAPDILVKGEDWRDLGVVGREFVEARGGRVVLAPMLEGRSTTNTLARLDETRFDLVVPRDDEDDTVESAIDMDTSSAPGDTTGGESGEVS